MSAVITFLGWSVLALVATMRFSVQPVLSVTERARRVQEGDAYAAQEEQELVLMPLLQSLHAIVKTLLVSAFITYCVVAFGVMGGVAIGTLAVLLLPLASRLSFVCAWADALRDAVLPWLHKIAHALRPLLHVLRARDAVLSELQLHSQTELLELVRRSPGILTTAEQDRLVASLAFDTKKVSDIMTTKSMIQAVKGNETLGPLVLDELYKTGYSRFPVYLNDIDHMIGMLYLHDLVDMKTSSKTAEKAMQPKVFYIHENHTLARALRGFLKTRHHLFVVVNDYRETVGLLSLEDIMEALIGDTIVDEFDAFDDVRAVAAHNPNHNNQPEGKKDV